MSRMYDAKQEALKAYPNNREAAIDLFLGYLDAEEDEFKHEMGQTPEEYLFGKKEKQE